MRAPAFSKAVLAAGFAFLTLFLSAATLRGQDEEIPAPRPDETGKSEGFFIGLSAHSLAFNGDLNGKLILWHFEKAFFSPKLAPAPGLGVGFGVKQSGWLWELGYVRSIHDAALPDRMTRAVYNSIEINGKSFFLKKFPLQPYISLGISVPWLTVRDGSEFEGARLNASYIGIGVQAGAGFVVDITKHIFISGGGGGRVLGYYYASGEGKGRDITELRNGYEGSAWKNWLRSSTLEVAFGIGLVL